MFFGIFQLFLVFSSVAESIHYELTHNSFEMSCELTHFTNNSEYEFKELLMEKVQFM